MKIIQKALMTVLGEKKYLAFMAFSFQRLYKTGKLGKQYQDIYFLKHLIRPGDTCVDIGAHLGYYTLELSRLAGPEGKVFAIEPMSKFHDTLRRLLQAKAAKNTTLYQLALGGQGEWVEMGIPHIGNMKRYGWARVIASSTYLTYAESEKVRNETGDALFRQLPRLDFIKCDVEGLEVPVFSSMLEVLRTHHPILLCELADKSERIRFYDMIAGLGYQAYQLERGKLCALDIYHSDKQVISHNHYFIHQSRVNDKASRHLFSDTRS